MVDPRPGTAPTPRGAAIFDASSDVVRGRRRRTVIGAVVTLVLVLAYVFAVLSYRAGFTGSLVSPTPAADRVAVVLVPASVDPASQSMSVDVLVFPGSDLLDAAGALSRDVVVTVYPTVGADTVRVAKGTRPSPGLVVVPVPGIVQEYPFDQYAWTSEVSAATTTPSGASRPIGVDASTFFRIPGWSERQGAHLATRGVIVGGDVSRAGSTVAVALLFLLMMVVLALIAVAVVRYVSRGIVDLSIGIASWLTAVLFALLPLRGFFPGAPPLGSWIDILVFFWVVVVLMTCVAFTVLSLLQRAREEARPPDGG